MTKITNITYRGITHTPSNISDKDGAALECVNLTQDATDLKPMPMPALVYDEDGNPIHFPKNTTLVATHSVSGEKHYILSSPNADGQQVLLRFLDQNGDDVFGGTWTNNSEIYAVESIGNTLVVSTANGIEYFYWKNGSYVYLGQKPPMPVLQFSLVDSGERFSEEPLLYTNVKENDSSSSTEGKEHIGILMGDKGNNVIRPSVYDYAKEGTYTNDPSVSYYVKNAEQNFIDNLSAKIANVKLEMQKNGLFSDTFFVRYAVRMKDGNYILHSQPIMMLENETITNNFICKLTEIQQLEEYSSDYYYGVRVSANAFALQFKCVGFDYSESGSNSSFADWNEVISSVDIFVSEQIDVTQENYKEHISVTGAKGIDDEYYVFIPEITADEYFERIKGLSLFYKVKTIGIESEELEAGQTNHPIDTDLTVLHNKPTLNDDFNTHCQISARIMQVYNSRLNLANISMKAYGGYDLRAFSSQSASSRVANIFYHLNKNGVEIIASKANTTTIDYLLLTYLYYPDIDCYKADVYVENSGLYVKYSVNMMQTESLNGSFWYNSSGITYEPHTTEQSLPEIENQWYSLPNRFAMSAVGNPWYFPIANMFEIGKEEIRSLSINAEELSYAQYGQNPILVLASDGTWSLGIQGDGSPKGVSYISSDVISKMETLTDSPSVTANKATFFVTERGLMMASGSKVIEIGREMHGAIFNCKQQLLPVGSVLPPLTSDMPADHENYAFREIINKVTDYEWFADYVKGGNLAWDYKHSRLLVINKDYPYTYVYDIEYKFWAKMLVTDEMVAYWSGYSKNAKSIVKFTNCVNNGTELYFQDNNGYLYNVADDVDENDMEDIVKRGFYISKPMRFGTDTFKTIIRLKHRFTKGTDFESVKMMLYGSRDGNTFYRVNTMRGSAYMYYIIVLYTSILPAHRYAYTSFEFEDRLTNKLR